MKKGRTAEDISNDIIRITEAISSPNKSVQIDDMQRTFKSASELLAIRDMLERELAEANGEEPPKRFIRAKRWGF